MDWGEIGLRIRRQREFLGYTREQFAEMIDITPKFCSDIELGVKGMSVPTLCRVAEVLQLSADYILLGDRSGAGDTREIQRMLDVCSETERSYAEELLKTFLMAMREKSERV